MEIRPILSTLLRHKTAATLIVLQLALTCAIICNALFMIGDRLQQVGEVSGIAEDELVRVLVEDAHAGDVARQQVWRELDPPDRGVDGAGEGLGEHRLADAGDVLDEQVPLGEQHGDRGAHDVGLALDDGVDRRGEA